MSNIKKIQDMVSGKYRERVSIGTRVRRLINEKRVRSGLMLVVAVGQSKMVRENK